MIKKTYDDLAREFFDWKEIDRYNKINRSDSKIKSYLFLHYHPLFELTFNTKGFQEFEKGLNEAIKRIENVQSQGG
jgi:hypothetical protein